MLEINFQKKVKEKKIMQNETIFRLLSRRKKKREKGKS